MSIIKKSSFIWPFKYQISDKLKVKNTKQNKCKKLRVLLNTAYSAPMCFSLIVEGAHFYVLQQKQKIRIEIYVLGYFRFILLLPLEEYTMIMEKRICFDYRYP